MEFASERLFYREFREADFSLYYSIFSNHEIMRYALWERADSEAALRPYFEQALKDNQTADLHRKTYEYAVFDCPTNHFVGFAEIEVFRKNLQSGTGEIGYFLLPESWGKGYAAEIAKRLCDFAFDSLQLHKVWASCNANNKRSEAIMKKAGMQKEGELREARYKNGRWDHELRYSILKKEWETQR